VQADPHAAAHAARTILEQTDDRREGVIARWALGFAERELADLESAEINLRLAGQEAAALGDEALEARITTSLALVVMNRGSPSEALAMIERPIALLSGGDRARAVMQRGAIRYRLADFDGALADHLAAVDDLRAAGDWIALARLHVNIGSIQSYRRDLEAAEVALIDAIDLAELNGQLLLAGYAHHNLGHIRALRGEVPAALAAFDVATQRYEQLGAPADQTATLMADQARTLADAGLHDEAIESIDVAYKLVLDGANTSEAADIALLTAQIRLDGDDPASAVEPAHWARDTYDAQGRDGWIPLVDLVLVCARADDGDVEQAQRAVALAADLEAAGWIEEAQGALIFAADRLRHNGRGHEARAALADAVRLDAVTLKSRTARWLAMGRQHELDGDLDAARAAVDAGLELLAANRSLLGAVELLSRSIESGADLARLGVEIELRRDNPQGVMDVLRRNLLGDPVAGGDEIVDTQRAEWLAELRRTVNDVRTMDQDSEARVRLRRRQAELERWIRDRSRQAGAANRTRRPVTSAPTPPADRLVTIEASSTQVISVAVTSGRPRLWRRRPTDSVRQLVETVDFALHRLNRADASQASMDVASSMLDDAGAALDAILIPDHTRDASGPLVITPTDVLHGLPWRVIPSLRHRALTVSATLGGSPPPYVHQQVLLVAGPNLEHADVEVGTIGAATDATILTSEESDVERVVDALGRSDLAHIACHGTFRADNPLFSALHLADGDLTIYELDRCARLPRTVILSACNAGQSAVLRGGALLGMANALLQMGVTSVIAPLSPVNDQRLVPMMLALHERLAAGDDAASALARVSIDDDGRLHPTAAPFVCFGR
jgi:tetratricopeptide (TPR) repeat protein